MARENKFASSGGAKQTLAGRPSYPKCGHTSDGCDAKPQPGHRSITPVCDEDPPSDESNMEGE